MSNKMALDALTAALDAMEHMANTLNNMDAVDEDEDAQHDAAFEAVRVAIAELKKPQKSRIVAAPMASYPEADQRFFNFWYGHMFEDLMQPPLVGIDHATARYIWNAAAIAALQAEPQPAPVHPNHRADLRYVRKVLDDVRSLSLIDDGDKLCGDVDAAINGMDYIINRTEEAACIPATPPKD